MTRITFHKKLNLILKWFSNRWSFFLSAEKEEKLILITRKQKCKQIRRQRSPVQGYQVNLFVQRWKFNQYRPLNAFVYSPMITDAVQTCMWDSHCEWLEWILSRTPSLIPSTLLIGRRVRRLVRLFAYIYPCLLGPKLMSWTSWFDLHSKWTTVKNVQTHLI